MNVRSLAFTFIASTLLLAPRAIIAAEAAATARTITIRAGVDNAMKFDVVTMTAAAGETIKVVLTNASTLPKEAMGHNWVLLVPGTDPVAFAAAGASEPKNDYIPSKMKEKVVASIPLLGPKETGEVTIKVPNAPGDYPFLCTFPAHGVVGMKGVLTVKK
jgi:azurin